MNSQIAAILTAYGINSGDAKPIYRRLESISQSDPVTYDGKAKLSIDSDLTRREYFE